jgi:hypothetical protein
MAFIESLFLFYIQFVPIIRPTFFGTVKACYSLEITFPPFGENPDRDGQDIQDGG